MSSAVVVLPKIFSAPRIACTWMAATLGVLGSLVPEQSAAAATAGRPRNLSIRSVGRTWCVVAALVAALVWTVLPALPAHAAAQTAPVVADVTTPHPRLLKNAAGFADLATRVSSDNVSSNLYATVLKNADAMLTAPVVTYTKPDGVRLLDTSRTVLDRSYTLMVAWKVSGNTKYADRLWRDLDAASNFPDWNPDHYLDTAEMTHAFAIAYDWGYPYWTSTQQAQLRQAILDKGLAPSLRVYNSTSVNDTPYKYLGNWSMRADNVNIVINSAMAMGALAVANDTSSDLPQQILNKSFASIQIGLGAYGPDGGFKEGPTYWEYATRYLTTFLSSLKTATGSDYGLASAPGLSQTASFMEALTGPGGQYYGFADSNTQFQPSAAYAGLGAVFNDPARMAEAATIKSSNWSPLQLVLRDPGLAARPGGAPTPLQNTFAAAGVTSMSGSRTDSRASYAAFRFGADPAASHQHFDAGDFGYQALGQDWAVDLGMESGTYDLLAQDRTNARWNYYRTRAEGHNTLAIDPFDPDAGSKTGTTKLLTQGADVDSAYAVADLSAAYPDEVSSWHRGVRLFDNRSQLLVQDEITAPGSIEALWSMHTAAEVQVAADGRSAVLYQNGERVLARIVSPGNLTFVRMAAAPLPTDPTAANTPNDGISKLAISVKGSNNVSVAVQLTPLRHGTTVQGAPAPVVPTGLATWGVAGATAPLSGITVNGAPVPGFQADQSSYTVQVPAGSAVPVVAATAPAGTVTVQQAGSVPGRARITVSGAGGSPTTYAVDLELARLKIIGVSTPLVSSGWGSATFDGNPTTYWGADAATANATWEIDTPTVVNSVVLSWRANSAKKTVFELATSNDKNTWVQRYAGQYVGDSGDQALQLSAGPASKYVRLTVHGDGGTVTNSMLNEVQLFDYDVRSEYPSSVSRPAAVTVSGVPSTMTVGQLATAAPAVTWTGSAGAAPAYQYVTGDPTVATVDQNGTVTAIGGGTTQIGVVATSSGTTVSSGVPVTVNDATKVRIYADADTYVESSTASSNYGTQYGMLVKPSVNGSADRVGYLHFDLSPLAGKTVTSAVLTTESVITDSLTTPSTERIDAHAATGSWNETTLTYPDRPALGATIGSFVVDRTKKLTSANVSSYVASSAKNGAGPVTLGLTQDDIGGAALLTTISTRESGQGAYIDVTLTPPPLAISGAVASATTSGSTAATYDGDPATYWGVDSNPGWLRWELASPAHVASMVLSWRANSAKKTLFEVETSNDTTTWTPRYAGQYLGDSGDQVVSLSSGVSVKYVRIVVHGDGGAVPTTMLNEVKLLGYDATAPAASVAPTVLKSVAVAGSPLTVQLGSTATPAVSTTDSLGQPVTNATLSYTSSNAAVASVDAATGLITGVTSGSASLTVTATAGGVTVTTSVPVTVVDSARIRIYASADTYVESSTASNNYGTQYGMLVKPSVNGSADRVGLMKFDLSPLAGKTVSSAVLSTENVISDSTTTPSTVRVDAHTVTGSWNEAAVTYASKPTLGSTVGSFLSTRTKATTSADLTSYVTTIAGSGASSMSLGLTQDDAGANARLVTVSTQESGKGAYLDVTLAPAPAASVPPTYLKSVAISGVGSTINLGSTTQAKATVLDSLGNTFTKATIVYSSANPGVASVSSTGVVSGATAGSTTITATASADGLTATASVAVTVADTTKVRIYAQADTYVQSSTASTNYGTVNGMLVKPSVNGSPDRVGYIKFDLTPLAGKTVTSAALTAESVISDSATAPSTVRVDAHSATGSWSETGMTYPDRPTLGPTIGGFVAERTKKTSTTDLTSSIKTLAANGTGSLTLGLTEDNAGSQALLVTVSSREASSKGAYIDVVVAP